MWQDEIVWRKLRGLIVILESLVKVPLSVIGASHLITAFSAHRFVFCVVESVQR